MPIIKSAKKRVRVATKAAIRNSKTKRSLKTAVKAFAAAVAGKDKKAGEALSTVQSHLAKAGKKGVMHKNKVARKQAQAARAAKAAGIKPVSAKPKAAPAKVAAKPAAKPVVAKNAAPAKKPAVKKAVVAKKPAAKKPAVKKASK